MNIDMKKNWSNYYESIVILLILLFSAVIRFSAVGFLKIEPFSDYSSYMGMAVAMLETGIMEDGQGNLAFYSSGYPLFLTPFFAVFGSEPETAQLVNAFLGVISVGLIYLCSKMVLPSCKWAAVPAVLYAVYPPAILYAEYIAKENLMVVLILIQVLILLKFPSSDKQTILSLLLGVVFGIALLVGPAIILTASVIIVVIGNIRFESKQILDIRWKQILLFIFSCTIILMPWLNYTNSKLGAPVLNTNGSFNLYLGNNENAKVTFNGIENTPMGKEWHDIRKNNGEIKAFSILREEAIKYILDNPYKTLSLSFKKIAYFWFPPIHEGKDGNKSKMEELMRYVWMGLYVPIAIMAFMSLIFFKQFRYEHILLFTTVILYCVIHAAAYIIFRYRLPIMPIMCILSVCSIQFFFSKYTKHE